MNRRRESFDSDHHSESGGGSGSGGGALDASAGPGITIRPWREIRIRDLPESRRGLEQLRMLFHDLLVRNRRFLGALDDHDVPDNQLVEEFLQTDLVLLLNFSLLLDGKMKPIEVGEVVSAVREQAASLADLRHRILTTLDCETATRIMDSEPDLTVRESDLSYQIVRARRIVDEKLGRVICSEKPRVAPSASAPGSTSRSWRCT